MSDDIVFDKFVPKGWGYERHIVNGPLYCGKILHFVKGRKCSIHYHEKKTETFYVNCGKVEVRWADKKMVEENIATLGTDYALKLMALTVLTQGDYFHITPGMAHQIVAIENSEIIEFSTTDFDSDSYRIRKGD